VDGTAPLGSCSAGSRKRWKFRVVVEGSNGRTSARAVRSHAEHVDSRSLAIENVGEMPPLHYIRTIGSPNASASAAAPSKAWIAVPAAESDTAQTAATLPTASSLANPERGLGVPFVEELSANITGAEIASDESVTSLSTVDASLANEAPMTVRHETASFPATLIKRLLRRNL
jgi:hypothetical protein